MLQYCEVRVRYYVVNHDGHRAYTSIWGECVCVGGVLDRKVNFGASWLALVRAVWKKKPSRLKIHPVDVRDGFPTKRAHWSLQLLGVWGSKCLRGDRGGGRRLLAARCICDIYGWGEVGPRPAGS